MKCESCNVDVETHSPLRKYCSKNCGRRYRKKPFVKVYVDAECSYCSSVFKPKNSLHLFCTKKCKTAARTERQISYSGSVLAYHYGQTPVGFLKYLLKSYNRKRTLSLEDLVSIFENQKGLCSITKQPLTWILNKGRVNTNISIDRIVPGGAYTKDNVRLVCRIINEMRRNYTDTEFKHWCTLVSNKED